MKEAPVTAPQKTLRVRLVRSMAGRPRKHRAILRGMGLTKLHRVIQLPDTPQVWGMINKVRHLVEVEREKTAEAGA